MVKLDCIRLFYRRLCKKGTRSRIQPTAGHISEKWPSMKVIGAGVLTDSSSAVITVRNSALPSLWTTMTTRRCTGPLVPVASTVVALRT